MYCNKRKDKCKQWRNYRPVDPPIPPEPPIPRVQGGQLNLELAETLATGSVHGDIVPSIMVQRQIPRTNRELVSLKATNPINLSANTTSHGASFFQIIGQYVQLNGQGQVLFDGNFNFTPEVGVPASAALDGITGAILVIFDLPLGFFEGAGLTPQPGSIGTATATSFNQNPPFQITGRSEFFAGRVEIVLQLDTSILSDLVITPVGDGSYTAFFNGSLNFAWSLPITAEL
jgi:hypothetical protein